MRLLERITDLVAASISHPQRYDGSQALEIMQQETPDIVLLDLVMPALDGRQTLTPCATRSTVSGAGGDRFGRDWLMTASLWAELSPSLAVSRCRSHRDCVPSGAVGRAIADYLGSPEASLSSEPGSLDPRFLQNSLSAQCQSQSRLVSTSRSRQGWRRSRGDFQAL